ncbi:Striatin-interacting protein 1-like [Oopsacas minuta]|uniref:Striatin-interacting protein 1-like n=1 Tax=Oopsacas minuta TaxID=111878 RepID=A0AAV7KCI4_9METZ|nr:Striatin-interacting protein 1-like [Oopsacas minuta]
MSYQSDDVSNDTVDSYSAQHLDNSSVQEANFLDDGGSAAQQSHSEINSIDPYALKEVVQRIRGAEEPETDLEFCYSDSESCQEELSQFYSYFEQEEVLSCKGAFLSVASSRLSGPTVNWCQLSASQKKDMVQFLLDNLDNANRPKRIRALQALLYVAQGCWGETCSQEELRIRAKTNCFRLLAIGVLPFLCEHLSRVAEHDAYEMLSDSQDKLEDDQYGYNEPTFQSNPETRCCLDVLYHLVEECRRVEEGEGEFEIENRQRLYQELADPMTGEENLATLLFSMLLRFCNGSAPSLPVKKVLLLLWKVILTSLGGTEELDKKKRAAREGVGLVGHFDESRLAVPLPDFILQPRDPDELAREGSRVRPNEDGPQLMPKIRRTEMEAFLEMVQSRFVGFKCGPAALGGELLGDLPEAIHDSLKVLEQHLYIPLSELQIEREKYLQLIPPLSPNLFPKVTTPYSKQQLDLCRLAPSFPSPTELLYEQLLPQLPQFMIALLKVLLAATPTKNKTESLNIYIDVCPSESQVNAMSNIERRRVELDVHRYTEVVVKGVSSILFLLLKHFKLNHVYQFEFVCHHLVFANCIPLILKFFNQNLLQFIYSKSFINSLEYPACLLYPPKLEEELELGDGDEIEEGEGNYLSWRNMFSCINLLRVLQKLTKWKPSRTMVLVAFKSAQILKKVLKIRHPLIQAYALKLLKMQTRYLGRNWRRNNMKIMSSIYQSVRHHLHDDWAYGNDLNARPCDFQSLEMSLKQECDQFNHWHYGLGNPSLQNIEDSTPDEFVAADTNPVSVLAEAKTEYDEGFLENWEKWVKEEVVTAGPTSRWDNLLSY